MFSFAACVLFAFVQPSSRSESAVRIPETCRMKTAEPTVSELKAQILARITSLETDLKAWRGRLTHFEETAKALGASAMLLQPPAAAPQAPVAPLPPGAPPPAIAALGLTQAVKQVLHAAGSTEQFNPVEVRRRLEQAGFVPKGKNFHVSVGTTLRRLAKSGVLLEKRKGKKRYYSMLREPL